MKVVVWIIKLEILQLENYAEFLSPSLSREQKIVHHFVNEFLLPVFLVFLGDVHKQ